MPEYRFEEIAINSTEKKKPVEADKDTYLGLEHLDSGSLRVMRWGAEVAPIGDKLVMYKGDVLFGRRRAYQKKVAIAPFDGIFSAHGMVLRPRTEVISERLFPFFIASDYFLDAAIKISVGSLSPTINWRDLKDLKFNIPPLAQQNELAEKMWAFEETKEAYSRLMAATDALVKSQFIEMFGDPVTNPMGWDTATIGEVCKQILGGGTPSKSCPDYFIGSIPWVSPKDMKSQYITDSIDHISEEAVENSTAKMIPAFSVLMVIRSGILKHDLPVAINTVPVAINQDMKAFVPGDRITSAFLQQSFRVNESFLLGSVRGFTADNIEFAIIRDMRIVLPPLELQNRFAAFVESTDKSKFATALCRNQTLTAPCEQNYDIISPSRRCF